MSICVTLGGQCCCMKIRVKWCPDCQIYICQVMYPGHTHMTPLERQTRQAQWSLIGTLYYGIYLKLQQLETAILDAARNHADNLDALLQEAAEVMHESQWNRLVDMVHQIFVEEVRDLRKWKDNN